MEEKARTLTHAEFLSEAKARFGEEPLDIAFTCPGCGDTAAIRDFPQDRRGRAGQECIGRALGALEDGYEGRGCNWTAYGLISGPWTVVMGNVKMFAFPFASKGMPDPGTGKE